MVKIEQENILVVVRQCSYKASAALKLVLLFFLTVSKTTNRTSSPAETFPQMLIWRSNCRNGRERDTSSKREKDSQRQKVKIKGHKE